MSKEIFDKVWDRWNTDAKKWDKTKDKSCEFYSDVPQEDIIPMWIADMDFAAPDCVIEALKQRIDHPIFGYTELPQRYIDAINLWQNKHFGTAEIKRQSIQYQNSVLGGVASAVTAFTMPGDYILTNESTYTGFQATVKNLGRYFSYSPLNLDENGIYRMDFEDMEAKIIENEISMMIFCSPHNPTGRVWEEWEIKKVVDLCDKYEVLLFSDEIWADFVVNPNKKHIPTQSVNDKAKKITIASYAPSKTFNLAGLIGSYTICYNSVINSKLEKAAVSTHYNNANVLSVIACCGAYEGGGQWVKDLVEYIRTNQEYMHNFFQNECKGVKSYLPEGTYLLWVDIQKTGMSAETALEKLKNVGVVVNGGKAFRGETFLRINVACPYAQVVKACEQMKKVFG